MSELKWKKIIFSNNQLLNLNKTLFSYLYNKIKWTMF